MLPSGFPWIVRDGIEALRWKAALQGRFLAWFERHSGETLPEDAVRHRCRELEALAARLEWLSDSMWEDGRARDYLTIVDIALLRNASRPDDGFLPAILEIPPEDIELHRREILALQKWLVRYLESS